MGFLEEVLSHPAVQAGIAPFLAALVVVAVFQYLRLGGLAAAAGFATAVFLISGFGFSPLTAMRKIVLLGLAAPVIGVLVDVAFKPTRLGLAILAIAAGGATVWTFTSVLQQRAPTEGLLVGGGTAVFVAWTVGFALAQPEHPVRSGAIGLGLGIGGGVASILGASALLGSYGLALGAGSAAFLLWQMVTGKTIRSGATLTLSATLIGGLLLAATLVLASMPWYALAVFALLPPATRLPVPAKSPVFVQSILVSVYALAVAAVSCALIWQSSRGMPG